MMFDAIFADLQEIVRQRLEPWPLQREGFHWAGYTYDHTLRVANLALHMARQLDADTDVVRFAALLHDIRKDAGPNHAQVGAEEVRHLLTDRGLPGDFVAAVADAIECHSGNNSPEHPVENLCVGDADLIDANFGLVGTWRFITIRSGRGEDLDGTIRAMAEWLPKKDALTDLLNTSLGRQIAMQRSAVMRRFCQELAVALENGHEDDSPLWLARYIHEHSDTGRLQQQLAALNGGISSSHRYPASVAPALQILHDEVAGHQ